MPNVNANAATSATSMLAQATRRLLMLALDGAARAIHEGTLQRRLRGLQLRIVVAAVLHLRWTAGLVSFIRAV